MNSTSLTLMSTDVRRSRLLYGVLLLWGVLLFVGLVLMTVDSTSEHGTRLYLIPWTLAAAVVIGLPTAVLAYRRQLDLFHPLVFCAWAYFVPGFVIGGMILAFGLTEPYYLTYVQDEQTTFQVTFGYIILGFGGMTVGFILPYVGRVGSWIGDKLPDWRFDTRAIAAPSALLLLIGFSGMIVSFTLGLFGYQTMEELPIYNGVLFLITLFWLQGSVLLWLYVFKSRFGVAQAVITAVLIAGTLARAAFQGNRGSLLQAMIVVAFAFTATRPALRAKHYAVGGVLFLLAVVVGMLYGSTFRSIKGTQVSIDPAEYALLIPTTIGSMADKHPVTILEEALGPLTERLDSVSSLAVVVSNYESLAAAEEQAGIAHNIWNESVTFFIPRLIWPDKPVGGVNLARYGELYFNVDNNAFLMTPMGDLLRNFGPWGVPLGMIFIGILLRLIYSALIEGRGFSYWRACVFFMLMSSISFEGTFADIVPYLCKAGFTVTLGILLIRYMPGRFGGRASATSS